MWAPRPNAAHDDRVDRDSRALTDFLATSEGLELVKAFMAIRDQKVRSRIVDRVRIHRKNHTEVENAANRVHLFPFVRQFQCGFGQK
jgi:hypothetical protein